MFDELVMRCGSVDAAHEYAGIGRATAFRIHLKQVRAIHSATAGEIIAALYRRRREDRLNGGNPRYIRQLRKKLAKEARIDRNIDKIRRRAWS